MEGQTAKLGIKSKETIRRNLRKIELLICQHRQVEII